GQPPFARDLKALQKPLHDVPNRVAELSAAVVVHREGGDAGVGGDAGDFGLAQETVDVIHRGRSGLERGFSHFALVGVDAYRDVQLAGQALNDRDYPPDLFVCGHLGEAATRRLATNVDDVGAVLPHLGGLAHGRVDVIPAAIARVGVGRDRYAPQDGRNRHPTEPLRA